MFNAEYICIVLYIVCRHMPCSTFWGRNTMGPILDSESIEWAKLKSMNVTYLTCTFISASHIL